MRETGCLGEPVGRVFMGVKEIGRDRISECDSQPIAAELSWPEQWWMWIRLSAIWLT
jgi:hypothetical protein